MPTFTGMLPNDITPTMGLMSENLRPKSARGVVIHRARLYAIHFDG